MYLSLFTLFPAVFNTATYYGTTTNFEIVLQEGVTNCLRVIDFFYQQPLLSFSLIHDPPGVFDVNTVYSGDQVDTTICVNNNSSTLHRASDIPPLIFLYSLEGQYDIDYAPFLTICPCGSKGYCDYTSTLEGSPTVLPCICDSLAGKANW